MWAHKKGNVKKGPLVVYANKLLRNLRTRLDKSNIHSGKDRHELDDGSIVEVSWAMGVPTIKIFDSGMDGMSTCDMYVESGMLDLGPNLAADAAHRFAYGRPVFSETAATLYFNTSDCTPAGGVNGNIQVAQQGKKADISSSCIHGAAASVTSRLTSPIKKQAQSVLPASSWSGFMRRYIAAIYGGLKTDYALDDSENVLITPTRIAPTCYADYYGLIYVAGKFVFVRHVRSNTGITFHFHSAVFSPCANKVFQLWKQNAGYLLDKKIAGTPFVGDEENAYLRGQKILTVALSECSIGETALSSFFVAVDSAGYVSSFSVMYSFDRAVFLLRAPSTFLNFVVSFLFWEDIDGALKVTPNIGSVGDNLPSRFGAALYTGRVFDNYYHAETPVVSGTHDTLNKKTPMYAYYPPDSTDLRIVSYSVTLSAPTFYNETYPDCVVGFTPYQEYAVRMTLVTAAAGSPSEDFIVAAQSLDATVIDLGQNRMSYTSGFIEESATLGVVWSTVRLKTALTDASGDAQKHTPVKLVGYSDIAEDSTTTTFAGASQNTAPPIYIGNDDGVDFMQGGGVTAGFGYTDIVCTTFPSVAPGSLSFYNADDTSAIAGITNPGYGDVVIGGEHDSFTTVPVNAGVISYDAFELSSIYVLATQDALVVTRGACEVIVPHELEAAGGLSAKLRAARSLSWIQLQMQTSWISAGYYWSALHHPTPPYSSEAFNFTLTFTFPPGQGGYSTYLYSAQNHITRTGIDPDSTGANTYYTPSWDVTRYTQQVTAYTTDDTGSTAWGALSGTTFVTPTKFVESGGALPMLTQGAVYYPTITSGAGLDYYTSIIDISGPDTTINASYPAAKLNMLESAFFTQTGVHLKAYVSLSGGDVKQIAYTTDTGRSIDSDRHTFTGGYPAVNNPSFIGWA